MSERILTEEQAEQIHQMFHDVTKEVDDRTTGHESISREIIDAMGICFHGLDMMCSMGQAPTALLTMFFVGVKAASKMEGLERMIIEGPKRGERNFDAFMKDLLSLSAPPEVVLVKMKKKAVTKKRIKPNV